MTHKPDVVVGLDTASNRWHVVELGSGESRTACCISNDSNPDVRRHDLWSTAHAYFRGLAYKHPGAVIVAEEPLSLKNGKTTRLLALAAGAIWAAHLEFDLFFVWADVAAWKKAVIGKGSASKDEIREWSLVHGGDEGWEEDSHDAFAIATYGAQILDALPQRE